MKYRSCSQIENFALNFNGRIDKGEKIMTLCCENVASIPGTAFCETAEESVEGFRRARAELIAESVRLGLLENENAPRNFSLGCAECANFQLGDYGNFDGLVHYVNLSMYPAPCQCKCIYCNVHGGERGAFNRQLHGSYYEKLFELLEYARNSGLIAQNATWQVSSGEIAIHPYKNRIMDLVQNQAAVFYTNCFIFDEQIAANLKANPRSAINLSIDSGTPQTWAKIKGVDNFGDITDNLVKYFTASARAGQITLKYIVLPGFNDNLEDYLSVIEIMKVLQVKHLTIARDTRIKYSIDEDEGETLIGAAGYLLALLAKNEMTADMFTYAPAERERVVAFAAELLQAGEV
jgi:wyosine [tRNA(Phe)-imidazoG37] synthetase (radical SAM superfamily)